MKIYNLNIDTSKPIRTVLNVPSNAEKYGIRVKATAGEYNVRNPLCQIIDGSTVIEATKKLDDGSFLFELTSGNTEREREVIARVIDMDEIDASGWDGMQVIYSPNATSVANAQLTRIVFGGPTIWWVKGFDGEEAVYYADTDPIVFKGDFTIGHNVMRKVGHRQQQVWEDFATIPKGTYTPKELNGLFYGGKIWKPADCKVRVVLRETKDALANEEIKDSVECIVVENETFVPTSLTIDGVEYRVLAHTVESETPTEPETPASNDGE